MSNWKPRNAMQYATRLFDDLAICLNALMLLCDDRDYSFSVKCNVISLYSFK